MTSSINKKIDFKVPSSKISSKAETFKKHEKTTLEFIDHLKIAIEEEESNCSPIINGIGDIINQNLDEISVSELGEDIYEEEIILESKKLIYIDVEWSSDNEKYSRINIITLYKQYNLDNGMICALAKSSEFFSQSCVLRLFECNLTTSLLKTLARALSITHFIRDLEIRWNKISPRAIKILFSTATGLEYLTLRGCKLNKDAAKMIGEALEWNILMEKEQCPLLSLNLNSNLIGCEGAQYLAKALRTNRTLIALSLANNNICDKGAIEIANSLKEFPLVNDEIKDHKKRYLQLYFNFRKYLDEIDASETEEFDDSHPFYKLSDFNGEIICDGNRHLQYLNLRHNYLSKEVFEQFKEVVERQIYLPIEYGLRYLELVGVEDSENYKEINHEIQKMLRMRAENV